MKYLFTQILRHPLLFLLLFYFITHLINLTAIPIFNDESIYLDWGWRETHTPGYLYYSLYDGKQPLLMWLFGIAAHILPDPLFAGRFISVICGALTLIGVYTLTLLLLSRKKLQ
jgi:4-amino-4-deoxy-L-arabinose transferase-like glycosyltransferase